MKTLKFASAAAIVACLLASSVSAFTPVGDVSVPFATPTVDGVVNADEYPAEGKVVINSSNVTAGNWLGFVPEEFSIDLYCAWDNTNFYVAGNVTDPNFNFTWNAEGYDGDAFQVSLNVDKVFKTEDAASRAVFYSWGLQEDGNIDVMRQESANNGLIEKAGQGKQTETGWSFEVALPLATIAQDASEKSGGSVVVEPGMPIGGLFCYLDHDDFGGLANAFGTSTTETMGWDPDAHGITFVFAEPTAAAAPAATGDVATLSYDEPANALVIVDEYEFELIDDDTTQDLGGHGQPIQFVGGYGFGYTSLNDKVTFVVDLEKDADAISLLFGYGNDDGTTGLVDVSVDGLPAGTIAIPFTGGWEIANAQWATAPIRVPAGRRTITFTFANDKSGSFSQVAFINTPNVSTEVPSVGDAFYEINEDDYYTYLSVEFDSYVVDNPDSNPEVYDQPICIWDIFGAGYTSEGDMIVFEDIDFGPKGASNAVMHFGYGRDDGVLANLAFYIDSLDNEPALIASIGFTGGWQVGDSGYVNLDLPVPAGVHTIYIKHLDNTIGSVSELFFVEAAEVVEEVVEAPVVETPVVEEVVETPAVEEVVETPVVEEVVETPVVVAPQTFDFGVIAAIAAIVSAAGYAISKKR